jgi:hypothetical protein
MVVRDDGGAVGSETNSAALGGPVSAASSAETEMVAARRLKTMHG